VDALGKAAQMLFVPPSALWGRIPGVEKTDVEDWKELAKEGDPVTKFQAELARQAAPTQSTPGISAKSQPARPAR
jgi:hypothetical protein